MLPAGFSASFGSERGLWGQGTYFSTLFGLASTYSYKLAGNAAAAEYKADSSRNVCQVLVADVLTGNYKVLPPNDQLKVPPEIDDANVARSGLHCNLFLSQPNALYVVFSSPCTHQQQIVLQVQREQALCKSLSSSSVSVDALCRCHAVLFFFVICPQSLWWQLQAAAWGHATI